MKAGVYTPEDYVEQERHLSSELSALQTKEQVMDISTHEVIVEIIKLSELLQDAYLHYYIGNSEEKEIIIRTVFSELKFSGNTLEYKCKNGFRALQNSFSPVCDPTGNRTPITGLKSRCPNR